MAKIEVQYPTIERKVIKTEAEAKALGYKKEIVSKEPVNRLSIIKVRQVARSIKEAYMTIEDVASKLSEQCIAQTGMTPSVYQDKFKRAWNN